MLILCHKLRYTTSMLLYVVRHGETVDNLHSIVSGRSDDTLTECGITQAQKVNLKLANQKFTAVYVSPMRRAIDTAEIVVPEYHYIIDERLAERDLGDLKGRTIDELWQLPLWNSLTVLRTPEGAETFGSGILRVQDFLSELKGSYRKNARILLITHSFISRCIWAITENITDETDFAKFLHGNGEVKIYRI